MNSQGTISGSRGIGMLQCTTAVLDNSSLNYLVTVVVSRR